MQLLERLRRIAARFLRTGNPCAIRVLAPLIPYFGIVVITCVFFLFPFWLTQVPIGYLYIGTDGPLHAAGIQRVLCASCFTRDAFFIGDLRPLSERYVFYPMFAWASQWLHVSVPVMNGWLGIFITLAAVIALYGCLKYLTSQRLQSFVLSLIGIPGVQLFGGIGFGGLEGGYNTHSFAVALVTVLFGMFVLNSASWHSRRWAIGLYLSSALLMNMYPLLYSHFLVFMFVYHVLFERRLLRSLFPYLFLCPFLAPVPFIDLWILYARQAKSPTPDLHQIMPYMYLENYKFFVATGRRFIAIAVGITGVTFLIRHGPTPMAAQGTEGASEIETTVKRIAILSAILTMIVILAEQFSVSMVTLQFSRGLSIVLFLSLMSWIALLLSRVQGSITSRAIVLGVVMFILIPSVSNIFYTVRAQLYWIQHAEVVRNQVALLKAIPSFIAPNELLLSPIGRIATEIRGFAGRSVLIAEKDRGAVLLDASRAVETRRLIRLFQDNVVFNDYPKISQLAREFSVNAIVLPATVQNLPKEAILYENPSWIVVRPLSFTSSL